MMNVAWKVRNAGHCWAQAHHVMKGVPRKKIQFFATWVEIQHPREGTILFDTGYTSRFYDLTKGFPNSIYARMTAVEILQAEEAKSQIEPTDVKHVLLSHLHADHVGGLRDFPEAQCWTSEGLPSRICVFAQMERLFQGVAARFDALLIGQPKPSHLNPCSPVEHPQLGTGWDLFEDGSIVMFCISWPCGRAARRFDSNGG